ncbi:flagellar FliJ family protein [Buchnera aphidicola (Formosaphis micheliae)]|uniref:flagellar FliJ family protein n=1 Tax=Buchnera aphidicola TaxID=9 RepID=UPI0031CCCE51
MNTISLQEKRIFDKLNLLNSYYMDYKKLLNHNLKFGIFGSKLKNYVNFIEVLSIGINKQNEIYKQYQEKLYYMRCNWKKYNSKLKMWRILKKMLEQKMLQRKLVLEQMYVDELTCVKSCINKEVNNF